MFCNYLCNYLVVDTWGKFQYGILAGNVNNFGDFDECVAFSHETELKNVGKINGKHFMISYEANNASDRKFGFDLSWNEL